MQINIKKTKELAKKDFEQAWTETSKEIEANSESKFIFPERKGKPHILPETFAYLRNILLDLGFDETENLTIIPEEDVYREYGPESAVILDRAFYIAKLPRPEIGIDDTIKHKIEKIAQNADISILKSILREYKKGNIEGDDMVEELVTKLNVPTEQATAILDLFPELKNIKPEPTNLTFRSHMSGTWYHTLAALQDKKEFPIMLFSIGQRYRNEQKEDAGHLRVHNSASIVIMDPNMNIVAGRRIAKKIFEKLGFRKCRFEVKKATSKYYAKGLEDEVFVMHNGKWLEIADMGMYSSISLANFGIKYPVFNVGFGVERLAMVQHGHKDIREMVFPQFFERKTYADKDIASAIRPEYEPKTDAGKAIEQSIITAAAAHKDDIAPVKVECWRGKVNGSTVCVSLEETEAGKKLLGPAAFNHICAKCGCITGELDSKENKETESIDSGLTYIAAIAKKAASDIEQGISKSYIHNVGMSRNLASLTLTIPEDIKAWMTDNNKKIELKGPVFATVTAELLE